MKKVMLKIEGMQKNMDGEENTIELFTEGKLYEKGDYIYLIYEETEVSGMEGCTTTVKLSKDKISMKRFGALKSEIIFEKGKRFNTNYHTPYGTFNMEVLTKEIEYSITDAKKGDIRIEYFVNLQGMAESTNKLNIKIM
ncbi:DUF1934 domain-containing protein [Crassaminicella thermophila]|uniref:DUF1934 domain-containing protein n=1 Tax=Crassaminicella thermophila TaxID=2599308 RepID=A0A5C0SGF0_CRATE|nr:DUF1934 domain-containing protein [Crassaminicella thermophila]QEK13270.1 DUF1934 domain-containing protein [Crassaminicella thermophila]